MISVVRYLCIYCASNKSHWLGKECRVDNFLAATEVSLSRDGCAMERKLIPRGAAPLSWCSQRKLRAGLAVMTLCEGSDAMYCMRFVARNVFPTTYAEVRLLRQHHIAIESQYANHFPMEVCREIRLLKRHMVWCFGCVGGLLPQLDVVGLIKRLLAEGAVIDAVAKCDDRPQREFWYSK